MRERASYPRASAPTYRSTRARHSIETAIQRRSRIRATLLAVAAVIILGLAALALSDNAPDSHASASSFAITGSEGSTTNVGADIRDLHGISARNALLVDAESGETLFEKASNEHVAPSSTAKLATALTALELLPAERQIVVGDEIELIDDDSSRAWLVEGDVLTVRQLLIALLLPSGNDAAYTLAVNAGRAAANNEKLSNRQAVDVFMDRVNSKAKTLGAKDTRLLVPDGFDVDGQHTTAVDLAIIAKACLDDPTIAEIVRMSSSTERWGNGKEVTFRNTNQLVDSNSPYYLRGARGLKTGRTSRAGACLVSAAEVNGRTCICVVMGSGEESRFTDSIRLYEAI